MTVSFTFPEEIEIALRIRAAETGTDGATLVTEMVTEQLKDIEH
jgi:predicted DNA-binding protein